MPSYPLVSIITPTLNQGQFLEHTIRSVARQSYRRFEHIVVDGGSTDETIEILRRHEGVYPMRWLSEPDKGMYEAVNKGMRLAAGDVLAYLNSDDLYFPWSLEAVVAAFTRHRDADFFYGDALSVDEVSGEQEFYWVPPFDLEHLRSRGFLAQPAVFWRRSAFEEIGPFDERLRYVADCDYWMRAGATHRFEKLNEFLAVERDHSTTQRQAAGSAVWAELAEVRSLYRASGSPRRFRLGASRESVWRRIYLFAFLLQSFVPRPVRAGPWRRLLADPSFHFSRTRLVLRMIPRYGRRLAGRVIEPSRHWLEPSDR